jgi:hypothetical protein
MAKRSQRNGRRRQKRGQRRLVGVNSVFEIPYTYTTTISILSGGIALSFNSAQFGLAPTATFQMFSNFGIGNASSNVQAMFRTKTFKVSWEPYYGTSAVNGAGAGAIAFSDGSNGYATSITTETMMGLRKHKVFRVGVKSQLVWKPSHPNDRLWNVMAQNSIFCQTVLPDAGFTFYIVASGCGTGTVGILNFTAILAFKNP